MPVHPGFAVHFLLHSKLEEIPADAASGAFQRSGTNFAYKKVSGFSGKVLSRLE
jgi:hypothetical protein